MCWLQAIDFPRQVWRAIKCSNLLRTKFLTNDKKTHMFALQVYEEAFPLKWNLDYVPPAHDQQGVSMTKMLEKWVR